MEKGNLDHEEDVVAAKNLMHLLTTMDHEFGHEVMGGESMMWNDNEEDCEYDVDYDEWDENGDDDDDMYSSDLNSTEEEELSSQTPTTTLPLLFKEKRSNGNNDSYGDNENNGGRTKNDEELNFRSLGIMFNVLQLSATEATKYRRIHPEKRGIGEYERNSVETKELGREVVGDYGTEQEEDEYADYDEYLGEEEHHFECVKNRLNTGCDPNSNYITIEPHSPPLNENNNMMLHDDVIDEKETSYFETKAPFGKKEPVDLYSSDSQDSVGIAFDNEMHQKEATAERSSRLSTSTNYETVFVDDVDASQTQLLQESTLASKHVSRRSSARFYSNSSNKSIRLVRETAINMSTRALLLVAFPHFFVYTTPRGIVDEMLQGKGDGAFYVRNSNSFTSKRVLCVMFGGIVLHYLLQRFDGKLDDVQVQGGVQLSKHSRVFLSLLDLISYYSAKRGILPCCLSITFVESLLLMNEKENGATSTQPDNPNHQKMDNDMEMELSPNKERSQKIMSLSSRFRATSETYRSELSANIISEPMTELTDNEQQKETFPRKALKAIATIIPRRFLASGARRVTRHVRRHCLSKYETEGRTINNFISCTQSSSSTDFQVLCKNVRQFMSGMRNFFIVQYGRKYHHWLEEGENDDDESVESIIEAILQDVVCSRLHSKLSSVGIFELKRNGHIGRYQQNLRLLSDCDPSDIGLNPKLLQLRWDNALEHLQLLHTLTTPIHKLQRILFFMDTIHNTLEEDHSVHGISQFSADDMLPLVIHLLLKTRIESFEVDASLMWALLEPQLMNGEAGYYCTTFTVAVDAIRTFDPQTIPRLRLPTVADMKGLLRVGIGTSLIDAVFKTISITNNSTAADVCEKICNKFNVSSPSNFCLYEVTPEGESLVDDKAHPFDIKNSWPTVRTEKDYVLEFREKSKEDTN
eukprot:m.98214 g.98214  ORF g.98214 m.98214 type:complete len:923 (+) comp12514_c0_seq2:58-2826(+)